MPGETVGSADALWRRLLVHAEQLEKFQLVSPAARHMVGGRYRRGTRPIPLSAFAQHAQLDALVVVGYLVEPPPTAVTFYAVTRLILEAWYDAYDIQDLTLIVAAMPRLETLYVTMWPEDSLNAIPCCRSLTELNHLWLQGTDLAIPPGEVIQTTIDDVAQVRLRL
jgi:hypothetical protein